MNIFNRIFSLYSTKYPTALVYMAQASEYRVKDFLIWFWDLPNFREIQKRGQLKKTKVAKLLLAFLYAGLFVQIGLSISIIYHGYIQSSSDTLNLGIFGLITAPVVWAYLLCLPMALGRVFIIKPQENRQYQAAKKTFAKHKAKKIAVLGSYGKTTMKELLKTVLENDLKVAATPANLNVMTSVANYARSLDGDEDVLIVEFGEERPGDIKMFADLFGPDFAVITGVAPAHLSHYKTIQAINEDLLAIARYVDEDKLYFNADSPMLASHIGDRFKGYSSQGVAGWKASSIKIGFDKTNFKLTSGKKSVHVVSGLLGRHQVGPLSVAVAIANELGLKPKQIETALTLTEPFEHRMQPRSLKGAWLIDDTYNGNLEGVKAGLALMSELEAKRKTYVTPGLVDQGQESERVHNEVGRLIAQATPDLVVLMKNSVTDYIVYGLQEAEFDGDLRLEDDPLNFYANIEHIVAKGDLVVMQNDWPDFYR